MNFWTIVMESDRKFDVNKLCNSLAWYQKNMNQECWNRL
jgi:hypothetical protein